MKSDRIPWRLVSVEQKHKSRDFSQFTWPVRSYLLKYLNFILIQGVHARASYTMCFQYGSAHGFLK